MIKLREYRIVTDNYAGYEAQMRRWWHYPFWVQLGGVNTHKSQEAAERHCKLHAQSGGVVAYLGSLNDGKGR